MVDLEMTIENVDHEDKSSRRFNLLSARWSSPWIVMLLVCTAGAGDGALRAYFNHPTTILGETVRESSLTVSDEFTMEPIQPHQRSLQAYRSQQTQMLEQKSIGDDCSVSWNCIPGLVCRDQKCEYCALDSECMTRNSKYRCFNDTGDDGGLCRHKRLFYPFDASDFWITLITSLTIMLAAPAGVGGGGILVPMYLAIGHFSPHYGIPLSKATIFGGAVANNFFNVQRKHPQADRPLVDYKTVMLMEPVLLIGSIVGVFFNALSPSWLITILIVLTLLYTTWKTGIKAYETYLKEEASQREAETKRLLPAGTSTSGKHSSHSLDDIHPQELRDIVEAESRINYPAIGLLFFAWIVIAVFSILKGGEGGEGIVACGTPWYWVLVLAPVPIVVVMVWYVGRWINREHELKVAHGYEFADGDLMWTKRNVRIYPLYCISAGFCAGALGIAGGTILGPVLLQLGMLPIVSTTTSGFTVLFTASSTTLQFLIMGQLQADYAAFFCTVGIVAGGVGNTVVGYFVNKYKKTWFIVAILTFILFLSAFLMGYAGYVRHMAALAHGKNLGARALCPAIHAHK
mmetsp:Transcript_53696/g.112039  ORF Transcript_53696/g.112039 Transcript_53696/m.112039 type:complete len:573 (-) Transcript_53696:79-1797(-)